LEGIKKYSQNLSSRLSPKQCAKFFKEEFGYWPSEYKQKEEK